MTINLHSISRTSASKLLCFKSAYPLVFQKSLIIIGGYGNHAAAARAARSSLKVEKVSIDKDFHPQCRSDAGAAACSLDTEFDIFDPDLKSQEFVGLVGSATYQGNSELG
jgi:hypothetical protein